MEQPLESFAAPLDGVDAEVLAEAQEEIAEPVATVEVTERTFQPQPVVKGIRTPGGTGKTKRATYVGVRSAEGQTVTSKTVWGTMPLYSFRLGMALKWADKQREKADEKSRREAENRAAEEAAEHGVEWL